MAHVPMGLWDEMDMRHTLTYKKDRWTSRGMSYGIMWWDRQCDIHASLRGTGGHPVEYPMVPWDCVGMDNVTHTQTHLERDRWTSRGMSHGIVGWDGQWDTHIWVKDSWISREMSHGPMGSWDGMDCGTHTHLREGQMDIPWNVLWCHGIIVWAVRYICMSERDRWTSHGMSHNPMGLWDGMDILRHFWTPM